MKKKHIIIILVIVLLAALVFLGGEMIGIFPWQYISEDKIDDFIKDSYCAFAYELPTAEDKVEWDSILTNDLANQITAVTYAARNDFSLDTQDDAYIISDDVLNNEKANLFENSGAETATDSPLLTSGADGYLLHLKATQESDLSYEIVNTFLGLKGSEPTRVTVLYTLNGQQCELEYVLTENKNSPYTFQIVDIELCDEE